MNSSNDIAERISSQSECELSRLDWYDTTIAQSYDTCKVASPGVLLAMVLMTFAFALLIFHEIRPGPTVFYTVVFRALFTTIIAIPFILLLSILCLVATILAVAAFNASSGFALKARAQVGITGGVACFICTSPLIFVTGSVTPQTLAFIAFGVILGNASAICIASWPSTWQSWGIEKSISKKTRRPQMQLKHAFSTTASCAAICSVAAISPAIGIATGMFVLLQAVLLLVDANWVAWRSTA